MILDIKNIDIKYVEKNTHHIVILLFKSMYLQIFL